MTWDSAYPPSCGARHEGGWAKNPFLCFRKETRRLREHYNVPETGLPWTAFITGPRPAPTMIGQFVFEPAVALALLYVIVTQGRDIIVPHAGFYALYPHPQLAMLDAWTRAHAYETAVLQLAVPAIALMLHNLYDWRLLTPRAPRQPRERSTAPGMHSPGAEVFAEVRARRR